MTEPLSEYDRILWSGQNTPEHARGCLQMTHKPYSPRYWDERIKDWAETPPPQR